MWALCCFVVKAEVLVFGLIGDVVEAPLEVEHEIARQHGAYGFGACLGVHCVADVAEIVEHVIAVEHQQQLTFKCRISKSGVPNKVVGVQGCVGVAAPVEHSKIGGNLEVCRQIVEQGNAGAERPCVLVGKVSEIGCVPVIGAAEVGRHTVAAEGV